MLSAPIPPRERLYQVAVIGLLGAWAAALSIVLLSASKLYSLAMLGATLFPLVLYASGNPRLFFLFGLAFTAPLGLSINFRMMTHIGGAPSFAIDVVDFFLVPLLLFLIRDFALGYRRGIRFSGVSLWWLGLILLGLWSIVHGPYREFAAFEVFRMLKLWLLFLVIINECVRERQFFYVVLGLAANLGLNVLVALAQFLLARDLGLQALGEASPEATLGANYGVYLSHGSVFRVGALMGHANLYAAYLALLLPIFVGLLFTRYSPWVKLLFAALVAAGGVTLILTLSRAGWVSFAFGMLLLMLVIFFHPALRAGYATLKSGMIAAMVMVVLVGAGPIIRRLTQSDSGALDFRWEWMKVAWRMVVEKPFTGFGLNSFVYHMADFVDYSIGKMIDMFGEVWPVVHNIYLLVWSEQGTLGLILFLGLLAHVFWIAFQNLKVKVSDKIFMLSAGAACGQAGLLIDGFASFFPRVPPSGRVYWVVIALIVAAGYWNRTNARRAGREHTNRQPAVGGKGKPSGDSTSPSWTPTQGKSPCK